METTLRFFYHFASVVGCRCEYYIGTLHCNFINFESFGQNLNFLFEQQIKRVSNSFAQLFEVFQIQFT